MSGLRDSAESKWREVLVDRETWDNLVTEHWNTPTFLDNWFGANNPPEEQ